MRHGQVKRIEARDSFKEKDRQMEFTKEYWIEQFKECLVCAGDYETGLDCYIDEEKAWELLKKASKHLGKDS